MLKDYSSSDYIADHSESLGEDGDRPPVQLLVEHRSNLQMLLS
jgi:hypothetical protein